MYAKFLDEELTTPNRVEEFTPLGLLSTPMDSPAVKYRSPNPLTVEPVRQVNV